VTFEVGLEVARVIYVTSRRKMFQADRTTNAKALRQECAYCVQKDT
jgi:hypothetical protein